MRACAAYSLIVGEFALRLTDLWGEAVAPVFREFVVDAKIAFGEHAYDLSITPA